MAHSDKVKWVREENKTGAFSSLMSAYYLNYTINCIVLTLKSGLPTTIKIGSSLGGEQIMWETDISYFPLNQGRCAELQQVPGPTDDRLYFDIASGVFDVDVMFIQRIGA